MNIPAEQTPFRPALPDAARRLDIRAPMVLGLAVIAAFFGAGLTAAGFTRIDKGVSLPGVIIVETRSKPVQHQRGGTVAKVHVREGSAVAAGDALLTFDTADAEQQLAALRSQSEASARQLDLARREAATIRDLAERRLASNSRVLALERQVAEIEKELAGLTARMAVAEQDIARAEVKAPVGGRVMGLAIHAPGAVAQPGQSLMEIVPAEDRLVVEGRLAPNQIENVGAGMAAKVWLSALSWREQRPLAARLAWVSADSVEDRRTGGSYFVARVELEDSRAEVARRVALHPGMRAEMVLLTGQRTLLDELVDPLMRNFRRAFRG